MNRLIRTFLGNFLFWAKNVVVCQEQWMTVFQDFLASEIRCIFGLYPHCPPQYYLFFKYSIQLKSLHKLIMYLGQCMSSKLQHHTPSLCHRDHPNHKKLWNVHKKLILILPSDHRFPGFFHLFFPSLDSLKVD